MKDAPKYLLLELRSVRIFDSAAPDDPDELPKVVTIYEQQTAPTPKRLDSLDLKGYDQRKPRPVLVDETRTIAVRANGEQSFDLAFGGDYRVLLQARGFESADGGAAVVPQLQFKSNYKIRLSGEAGFLGPNTYSMSSPVAVGTTLIFNPAEHRFGHLFLGTWLGVNVVGLASTVPAGAEVAAAEDEAQLRRAWDEWKPLEKAELP